MICSIDGCDGLTEARGWCSKHYQRWKAHGDPLVLVEPKDPAARQAWIDAALASDTADCLDWPWGRHAFGYGMLKQERVHVLICTAAHGVRPAERVASHSCGRPQCCNPRHLRWATRAEDSSDRRGHGTHIEGEWASSAKLTEADVLQVRSLRATGDYTWAALAEMFGVSMWCVRSVVSRRTWKHVA